MPKALLSPIPRKVFGDFEDSLRQLAYSMVMLTLTFPVRKTIRELWEHDKKIRNRKREK